MRLAFLACLAIISAALAALSLPSFSLGALAWIALAPLLFALRQRSVSAAAFLGALFGLAFGAGTLYWISEFPAMNAIRFLLLGLVFSLYYLAFGFLYALASRLVGSWLIVVGPALWVALEYARGSAGSFAFPWNFLGHSQYQALPLIQIADLTGAYGVSFLLMMVNQLASQLPDLRQMAGLRWRAQTLAVGAALAAVLVYGWQHLVDEPAPTAHVRVAIVQANVAARNGMSSREQMKHLAGYDRLTRETAKEKPDLIVWPSSSLPGPISFWMIRLYVADIAHRAGVPLLVGGAGGDKLAPAAEGRFPFSNSQILVAPSGRLEGQYDKIHLTPFTEQVPLQGLVKWPSWISAAEKGFVPGNDYTLFQVSGARFGAPICWENTFPDLFRRFVLQGADFMVSVTNENAFGATSGPYQTLAMNVFRAVENRVAVARAATTGVSAFIDSRGRIVSRIADARGADLYVAGVLVRDVPLAKERSFYTRYGDVFARAVAIAALAMLLIGAITGRARRGTAPAGPPPAGYR